MQLRRASLSAIPVVLLLCQTQGMAQETAPPATAAAPAPIRPVLDAPNRSIRLDPLGVSVAIPANMAIQQFDAHEDFMSISGDFGQYNFRSFDVRFSSGGTMQNCEAWFASSKGMSGKLKEPRKGAEFYDSRWHPKYYESKDGNLTLCMDRPGGFLFAETWSVKGKPVEPMKQFTTNLADAFLPRTTEAIVAEAIAAAKPAPKSSIDVTGLFPEVYGKAYVGCEIEGRPAQCQFRQTFRDWHLACVNGDYAGCKAIGNLTWTSKEYRTSAMYYLRACELGDPDSCKKSKEADKRDRP